VRLKTNQLTAMRCIQVPIKEMAWPEKYNLKFGYFNALTAVKFMLAKIEITDASFTALKIVP
jgi:hypothetical protein